jgi:hypothetical protein
MSEAIVTAIISAASGVVVAFIGAWASIRKARAAQATEGAPPAGAATGGSEAPKPGAAPRPVEPVPTRRRRGPGVLILVGAALIGAAVVLAVLYAAGIVGRKAQPPKSREEQIRDGVRLRVTRSKETFGQTEYQGQQRNTYEWSLWIEAPADVLDQIVKVSYNFDHPSYGQPRLASTTRANGFKITYQGVGVLNLDREMVLTLRDGGEVSVPFNGYETWKKQ